MDNGPLDHPRLRAIDQKLNEGDLDGAQRALGSLGDVTIFLYATTYLATRLLYLRGRLSDSDVIERLEELISRAGYFPEAEAMLVAAQSGSLDAFRSLPDEDALPTAMVRSGANEDGKPDPAKRTLSDIGFRRLAAGEPVNSATPSVRSMPAIPRAARLPDFALGVAPRLETPVPPPRSEPPAFSRENGPSTRPAPAGDSSVQRAPRPGADGCSLAELATLLDEGRVTDVLCALDGPVEELGPEHALLRGRALQQAGYTDKAIHQLERLSNAPLLDPQIRSEVARLLLQLGRPALALEQADAAFKDDPDAPLGRLTFAQTCLHCALLKEDAKSLLDRAAEALQGLKLRAGPFADEGQGVRALLHAQSLVPERAIPMAQRALATSSSPEALLALGVASARLGLARDARLAQERLNSIAPAAAETLDGWLSSQGVGSDLPRPPSTLAAAGDVLLDPVEAAWQSGDGASAIDHFEHLCSTELSRVLAADADPAPSTLAESAARLLTTAPLFSHFAPFDRSLWSIARLEAGLDLTYGERGFPQASEPRSAAVRLLAAYLEHTLSGFGGLDRAVLGGSLAPDAPEHAAREWLLRRLAFGAHHEPSLSERLGPPDPNAERWCARLPVEQPPPCPWNTQLWPDTDDLVLLAAYLPRSAVNTHCELRSQLPLDFSVTSLAAVDNYLSLIAPLRAPREAAEPWMRRVSVLVGSYLGEVIRQSLGGEWQPARDPTGPDAYVLSISPDLEAWPILQIFDRLRGANMTLLVDHVARLSGKKIRASFRPD